MQKLTTFLLLAVILSGCIGTDIVDDKVPPRVSIKNPIDSLKIGETYQFTATYYNESGVEAPAVINWSSTNSQVVSISNDGLASALQIGSTQIVADFQGASDTLLLATNESITVEPENTRSATLMTVSSYPLSGKVFLEQGEGASVTLRFSDDFNTTSALPGLYVYLSNNVNSKENAYEVGAVVQFTGAQQYILPETITLSEYDFVLFYCKPFNVSVGNGEFMP